MSNPRQSLLQRPFQGCAILGRADIIDRRQQPGSIRQLLPDDIVDIGALRVRGLILRPIQGINDRGAQTPIF